VVADTHEKVIGYNGTGAVDHEPTLVEMVIPRRGGVDRDTNRPHTTKNSPNTSRLIYEDKKLADPEKRAEFKVALLATATAATQSIKKRYSTVLPDQTDRPNKTNHAFDPMKVAIHTAAQSSIGCTMKIINNTLPRKKKIKHAPPDTKTQHLLDSRETLQ